MPRTTKTIYLDNQATTPVDPRVFKEMLPLFREEYGNPHSLDHIVGWRAAEVVERSRQRLAAAIGADPDEIIFTSGATESNNFALFGAFRKKISGKRNKILISATEHKCVLESCFALARDYGAEVKIIPVDSNGNVELDFIETELDDKDDVLLVSVMAVNNELGTIQPIYEIGNITRDRGVIFHCDAAQALSAIDIDIYDCNIDILSLSAHKMYGPQGVGALFIRREIQGHVEPLIYGGGQQLGLRSGTVPVALCAGFASAVELLCSENASGEREVISRKRNRLVEGIAGGSLPILLNGPPLTMRHPGNANLLFSGFANHDIIAALQPRVAASTGSACTSGTPEPSYVLRAIGLSDEEANSSIRFSVGRFTTDAEVESAIEMIHEVLSRLT